MTVKLRGGDHDGVGYDEGAATAGGGWEGAGEPPVPLGAKSASGGSSLPASERDGHPWSPASSTQEGAGEAPEGRSRCDGEPDAMAEGERRRDRLADVGDDGETNRFISFEMARLQPAKGKRLW